MEKSLNKHASCSKCPGIFFGRRSRRPNIMKLVHSCLLPISQQQCLEHPNKLSSSSIQRYTLQKVDISYAVNISPLHPLLIHIAINGWSMILHYRVTGMYSTSVVNSESDFKSPARLHLSFYLNHHDTPIIDSRLSCSCCFGSSINTRRQ